MEEYRSPLVKHLGASAGADAPQMLQTSGAASPAHRLRAPLGLASHPSATPLLREAAAGGAPSSAATPGLPQRQPPATTTPSGRVSFRQQAQQRFGPGAHPRQPPAAAAAQQLSPPPTASLEEDLLRLEEEEAAGAEGGASPLQPTTRGQPKPGTQAWTPRQPESSASTPGGASRLAAPGTLAAAAAPPDAEGAAPPPLWSPMVPSTAATAAPRGAGLLSVRKGGEVTAPPAAAAAAAQPAAAEQQSGGFGRAGAARAVRLAVRVDGAEAPSALRRDLRAAAPELTISGYRDPPAAARYLDTAAALAPHRRGGGAPAPPPAELLGQAARLRREAEGLVGEREAEAGCRATGVAFRAAIAMAEARPPVRGAGRELAAPQQRSGPSAATLQRLSQLRALREEGARMAAQLAS